MRQRPFPRLLPAGLVLALGLVGASASAAPGTIEKIEVEGNEFVSDEAFLALTDVEVGDAYDEQALRTEFRKIYDSGLFEDLRIESADGPAGGKVVIFRVVEKPRVDSVQIETVKALPQDRIDEELKRVDAAISPGSALNQEKVGRAKRLLEEMLAAEGYPDARVTVVQRTVARNRVALEFKIDPGSRIKIESIDFVGNTVYTDDELRERLRFTRQHGLMSMMSDKSVYYRARFQEDLRGVVDAYRSKGYIDVEVGEAVLRDARPGKSGKEDRRFVTLEVPVTEGPQYRLGELTISGNAVFETGELRTLIPLAEGEVLNDSLLKLGLQRIDNRYGDNGYLYAASAPRYDRVDGARVASVDVQITEGAPYTVRRIDFDGNARTKDEVLRREMRLSEGDLFSRRDFLISTRKIAQLGFWELDGEPTITPAPTGKDEVDITVRGKEVGRNEIQFGGGFSGVDGFFATFSFFSRNFMGRGSQFSASGQLGGESTRYSLAYVEPFFLRTKSTVGGSVFARDQEFSGFDREGQGGTVFWSYPTSTFSFFRTTVSYENSKIVSNDGRIEDDEFTTYAVTPSFAFDDRDNPFRPTRGKRLSAGFEVGASKDEDPNYDEEEFVQGTINFVKPELGYTQYWRTFKRQYIGVHAEGGLVEPLTGGATDPVASDGIDTPFLPLFERYFLGGDRSIRGVETRSVGPRAFHFPRHGQLGGVPQPRDCNADGDVNDPGEEPGGYCGIADDEVAVGGDAYWLLNFEYNVPFSTMFEATAFVDVGNAFGVNHVDLSPVLDLEDGDRLRVTDSDPFDAKATAGIELRFHTPVLQQPLRLIYGCKVYGDFDDDQATCDFQFSIGRTFQ